MNSLRNEGKEPTSDTVIQGSSLDSLVTFFKSELKFLQGKINTLEAPNRGRSIEVGGFKFGSIDDCRIFL